jgi:hypothetical protein
MTVSEWLERFGEPANWALATAIQQQISGYQAMAALLHLDDDQIVERMAPTEAYLGARSAAEWRAMAEDRIRRSVIDLERAQQQIGGIQQSGGWGVYAGFVEP